jgi:anaerobic selenocysteine-containing dehydrogenase
MSTHRKISRRTWLKGMAAVSAAAGLTLMLASTSAEAKASKVAVHYQDRPNGMRMCHMCKFYIAARGGRSGMGCMGGSMMGMMGAGACQVVEGRISPMGYCDLYAPRGA